MPNPSEVRSVAGEQECWQWYAGFSQKMQMIGCYRKSDVFVSCGVCFSSPHIRIANKLQVSAVIYGWSETGLKN